MKIAVLISGEYRTFPICRKTMAFLDDPRVDVYFSTWDTSVIKNDLLGLDICDKVSRADVERDLGKSATVLIDEIESFKETRYNSRMIHRWCRGFQLVRQSGHHYDAVIVMRPDLFFNLSQHFSLEALEQMGNTLKVAWYVEGDPIQDIFWACTYSKADELFNRLSVGIWEADEVESDWHRWWTSFCSEIFDNFSILAHAEQIAFARSTISANSTWNTVRQHQMVWSDATVLKQKRDFGLDFIMKIWSADKISAAEARWDSGFYNQFKNKKLLL